MLNIFKDSAKGPPRMSLESKLVANSLGVVGVGVAAAWTREKIQGPERAWSVGPGVRAARGQPLPHSLSQETGKKHSPLVS